MVKRAGYFNRQGKVAVATAILIAFLVTGFVAPANAIFDSAAVVAAVQAMGQMMARTFTNTVTNNITNHISQQMSWLKLPGMPGLNGTAGLTGMTAASNSSNYLQGSMFSAMTTNQTSYTQGKSSAVAQYTGQGNSMWNFANPQQSLVKNVAMASMMQVAPPNPQKDPAAAMVQDYRSKTSAYSATQGAAGIVMADAMDRKYMYVDPSMFDTELATQAEKDTAKMVYDLVRIQTQILRVLSAGAMVPGR